MDGFGRKRMENEFEMLNCGHGITLYYNLTLQVPNLESYTFLLTPHA